MRKINKAKIARLVYHAFSDIDGDYPSPPGSACQLEFGEIDDGRPMEIATTGNNDGSDLWLGWRSEWHVFYKAKEARRLAWFILWTWWIKGTWCGLKRKIWYWALHVEVEEMRGTVETTNAELDEVGNV